MKPLVQLIENRIAHIQADENYKLKPAKVTENPHLALIQMGLETELKTLKQIKTIMDCTIDPCPEEAIWYTGLFAFNFTKDDIANAFKSSEQGWQYFWEKYQLELDRRKNPAHAMIYLILMLDHNNLSLFSDYLFQHKYKEDIKNTRAYNEEMKEMETETQND